MHLFKVAANKNIGGKGEVERYEDGILTKKVKCKRDTKCKTDDSQITVKVRAAKEGKRFNDTNLLKNDDGTFFKKINGEIQKKNFEVFNIFLDESWVEGIEHKIKAVHIKFPNKKVIEKGEFVMISAVCSPSIIQIEEAFKNQLGKILKGNLSTDFFTITKV